MSKKSSEQRNFAKRVAGITMPITRRRMKWSRNWSCLCGSDRKYKHCCMGEIDNITKSDDNANVANLPEDLQKMIEEYKKAQNSGDVKKNG